MVPPLVQRWCAFRPNAHKPVQNKHKHEQTSDYNITNYNKLYDYNITNYIIKIISNQNDSNDKSAKPSEEKASGSG